MRYSVILADPPVPYEVWSKDTGMGRSAEAHYPTMSWDDLYNLGPLIEAVAAPDALLFLWVCPPLLVETLMLGQRWGFIYKTKAFCWVKLSRGTQVGFHMGMGYWSRANTEDVFLFARGNPKRARADVRQLLATMEADVAAGAVGVLAPVSAHSAKPSMVHDRIERLINLPGQYLELFARRRHPGWVTIGNELDGLDIRDSLARLAADESLPQAAQSGTVQLDLLSGGLV